MVTFKKKKKMIDITKWLHNEIEFSPFALSVVEKCCPGFLFLKAELWLFPVYESRIEKVSRRKIIESNLIQGSNMWH